MVNGLLLPHFVAKKTDNMLVQLGGPVVAFLSLESIVMTLHSSLRTWPTSVFAIYLATASGCVAARKEEVAANAEAIKAANNHQAAQLLLKNELTAIRSAKDDADARAAASRAHADAAVAKAEADESNAANAGTLAITTAALAEEFGLNTDEQPAY